jgi:hypothetical protein
MDLNFAGIFENFSRFFVFFLKEEKDEGFLDGLGVLLEC